MVWETRGIIRVPAVRGLLLLLASLVFVQFGLPQGSPALGAPDNPLAGSPIFIEKGCIRCHAVLGFGESFGPDLTQVGREMDFFQIAGALWSHSPKMMDVMSEKDIPRFVLTPEETESLITFLYYLGFLETLGDYAKGEEIFSQKGCGECHALGGRARIPLDKYGRYVSPAFVAAELWNHSASISAAMSARSFEPGEMSHLLAFIRSEASNPEGETVTLQPGNPRSGEETFREKKCFVCHGENGRDLKTKPLRKGLSEIVGMMWNHSSQMWAEMKAKGLSVPHFSAKEMADLLAFLYFLQFYGDTGDIPKGEKVFVDKGCVFCHGPQGRGNSRGIDLTAVSKRTLPGLISAMWNHVPEMAKSVSEFNIVWPRFEKNEMKDLLYFIQSLNGPARRPAGSVEKK
jgi:cytochrome c